MSTSGGYLAPSSVNGDLNDIALATFLQQIVVGTVGLPGPMVRPRWQPESPNIPDFGTNWAAIGPGKRTREPFVALLPGTPGSDSSTIVRNRTLEILCSFYGPAAEANSELLAMGLAVPKNRYTMNLAGFNLVGGVGDSVPVPVLLKQRWTYRVDVPFVLRQQQQYTYGIAGIASIQGTLYANDGSQSITETITVADPPAQS